MSEDKVIQFAFDDGVIKSIADKKLKNGDLVGGINAYFSSLKNNYNYETLGKIAEIYAEMGLVEHSNYFWFKYLNCSPKEAHFDAYEELAMNYFELNNLLVSSIYLHKRLDGSETPLSSTIDEELISMLGEAFSHKKQFRVVYPKQDADYSKEIKEGISAVKCGNYKKAIHLLRDIPDSSSDFVKSAEYLAIAYYLSGDTVSALNLNDEILYKNPNSISVLCNQSSILFSEKRLKESRECYDRAINIPSITAEDKFKIATCSLEQNELKTAIKNFNEIIKEDSFDINVILLYAQALINDEQFVKAEEVLSRCYKIDPENIIIKFYLELAVKLKDNDISIKTLPVPYGNVITVKESLSRIKFIDSIYEGNTAKFASALRNEKTYEILTWGTIFSDFGTAKKCVCILTHATTKKAKALLSNFLISDKVSPEIKQSIIYGNLINGNFAKFAIVLNEYYMPVKPIKPQCLKLENSNELFISYAIAFAKLTVCGLKDFTKLAKATDKVFFKFREDIKELGMNYEETAMLITMLANYSEIKQEDYVKIFEVKKSKLKQIKLLIQETEDDKDN